MNIQKFMVDICPFRIGQTVQVKPTYIYADDWRGTFMVTGLRWEYQRGDGWINIEIANADEIERGYGSTDGFRAEDLEPV